MNEGKSEKGDMRKKGWQWQEGQEGKGEGVAEGEKKDKRRQKDTVADSEFNRESSKCSLLECERDNSILMRGHTTCLSIC